jgi:tetratricopeptide (TPR) repeat protein
MVMAAEGLEIARRTGDRNAQYWIGNNLADLHHRRGEMREAIAIQEQAIGAAEAIGLHRNSGLPEYTHLLLNAGRFDEARAAWDRVNTGAHDTEPQGLGRKFVLESLFAWARDPASAIAVLRDGVERLREAQAEHGLLFIAIHLGRMGLRLDDAEATAEAAVLGAEYLARDETNHYAALLARWLTGLADRSGDSAAAHEVASIAADLEQRNWGLMAANAFTDAALLADRLGLAERDEWSARAEALFRTTSAVPSLEALRSGIA